MGQENVLVIDLAELFDSMGDHCVRREVKSVNAEVRADSSLDGPALVDADCHTCAILGAELGLDLRVARVGLQVRGSAKLHDDLDGGYQGLVSCDLALLSELLFHLSLSVHLHQDHFLFVPSLK